MYYLQSLWCYSGDVGMVEMCRPLGPQSRTQLLSGPTEKYVDPQSKDSTLKLPLLIEDHDNTTTNLKVILHFWTYMKIQISRLFHRSILLPVT